MVDNKGYVTYMHISCLGINDPSSLLTISPLLLPSDPVHDLTTCLASYLICHIFEEPAWEASLELLFERLGMRIAKSLRESCVYTLLLAIQQTRRQEPQLPVFSRLGS